MVYNMPCMCMTLYSYTGLIINISLPDPAVATTLTLTDQPTLPSSATKAAVNFTNLAVTNTATQDENDTTKFLQSTESDSTLQSSSNHSNDCHCFIAWSLVATSTVLFIGSFAVNITVLWVYKKRQAKDNCYSGESRAYEMEGNPCYEASNDINYVKQMADTQEQEIHVYERVRQNKPK